METAGNYLKNSRTTNNISLREVALKTKITPIYLEYIEKNEFDKIPQGPYIIAYLSSFSSAIGCDVDTTIKLYESSKHKCPQAEATQIATALIDGKKHSADKSKTKRQKIISSLRLGNFRSWFNTLVSFVAAKKSIDTTDPFNPNNRKPFRSLVGRAKQSDSSETIHRWSINRRIWIYACIALSTGLIVFFAAVGYYLLFYAPDSSIVAKAETIQRKKQSMPSPAGSLPSMVASPSIDAFKVADTPKDIIRNDLLSEPAKSDVAVFGVKPKVDILSITSRSTIQSGVPASESPTKTKQSALHGNDADVKISSPSDQQQFKSEPPHKPIVADASMRVLKAEICRAINNRMPAGVNRPFFTSDGNIFVWTQIEAKQIPSKIHHIYYFNGQQISDVSLDIRSTPWRTWSSKKIDNHRYRGKWRVDIATLNGDILQQLYFEVK